MNNNVVNIGSVLKWRSTYDRRKRYYKENITTMMGSVFRCKVLSTVGKDPVMVIDAAGHVAYTNTDVWDVLVDMVTYYNYYIDCKQGDVNKNKFITEYNVSVWHPKEGEGGTDRYTLAAAILKIPQAYRKKGIRCTFSNRLDKIEVWMWNGGTYDDISTWSEYGSRTFKVSGETLITGEKIVNGELLII